MHATFGKGEKVGKEPTAPVATPEARKTPRGARPNRRGEPARLTESAFMQMNALLSRWRKPLSIENPRVGCWIPIAIPGLEE